MVQTAGMGIDTMVPNLPQCGAAVARQEQLGPGASWTTETAFDPFIQLAQAAARTSRIKLGTAVAACVAGEVADGFVAPPLASTAYLRERQLPAVTSGWRRAHDGPVRTEICVMPLVVTGRDQAELDAALAATRQRIAFYASTPAYAGVFDLHGWAGVREQLSERARRQEWPSMAALVSDAMLETLATIAPPAQLLSAVRARYAGLAQRAILYPANDLPDAVQDEIFAAEGGGHETS